MGKGIKSGSMDISVELSTLVCVIVGANGIVDETDVEIVDELVTVSLSVVVIIGGVGIVINLVVELMHSALPSVFLMHDDEISLKIHPMGHGRRSK